MWGYVSIVSGMSMVLAICITIIILIFYKDLYSIYISFKPSELRISFYAFTSFLFASLILATLNMVALILSSYTYEDAGIALFIQELSFILYNIYLGFGLLLFIYSDLKHVREVIGSGVATSIFIFTIGISSAFSMMMYIKITSLAVALEVFILLAIYMKESGKIGGRLFSGRLWEIALLLIFIGRIVNVFDLIPLSYLSIIYLDLFAFATLLILQLEAKFELREGKR